jgi:hypothetical protein
MIDWEAAHRCLMMMMMMMMGSLRSTVSKGLSLVPTPLLRERKKNMGVKKGVEEAPQGR